MTITQSIQISRMVDFSATNGTGGSRNGSGVLTTAANEYAILNINFGNTSGSPQIFAVGTSSQSGVTFIQPNTIYAASCPTASALNAIIYVPPSTTIYYGTTDTSSGPPLSHISISGPVFINTTS